MSKNSFFINCSSAKPTYIQKFFDDRIYIPEHSGKLKILGYVKTYFLLNFDFLSYFNIQFY